MCQLGRCKALGSVHIISSSLSFHPVNIYLTYHCICEYIILFAFHAQFELYPGTWLDGHAWQKKQYSYIKWSVYTWAWKWKIKQCCTKDEWIQIHSITNLANPNNSSNARMLHNMQKCTHVSCVLWYADDAVVFIRVWVCGGAAGKIAWRWKKEVQTVTRGGKDSKITRWMDRCRDGNERKRLNDGKETGQQGRDCGNNTGLFHSIF